MLADLQYFLTRPSKWRWAVSGLAISTVFLSSSLSAEEINNDAVETEETKAAVLNRKKELALEREKIVGSAPLDTPPPLVAEPENLIARSAILCFGENLTLVPKQAVIYIPPDFEGRMKASGDPKIVNWGEFFALNKGWITTLEVTQQQIEGKTAIPPEQVRKMKKERNVVIATLEGDPITVLPLVTPPPTPKLSEQTTTDQ